MEEKIKIYVPESVNSILLKDMERFEFYKKDGSFNKNEFYNTLILNYYEDYQEKQSDFFNHIKETIKNNSNSSDSDTNDMASKILAYTNNKTNNLIDSKSSIVLALKPTRKSSDIIDYISDCCLNNTTLSSYFRNMFSSYTLLPQDKRERIIFKQNFELIEKAISENKKIYFTTTNNPKAHIASPYSIENSKEELFNYLLVDYNNEPYSYRVGRMKKIKVLNESSEFKKDIDKLFELMKKHGPQYKYSFDDLGREIKVLFTEKGLKMYKAIYLHRPPYTKIEGNYYYFECSNEQAFQYFSRLGSNAIIIEPKELANNISSFYYYGNKAYKKII